MCYRKSIKTPQLKRTASLDAKCSICKWINGKNLSKLKATNKNDNSNSTKWSSMYFIFQNNPEIFQQIKANLIALKIVMRIYLSVFLFSWSDYGESTLCNFLTNWKKLVLGILHKYYSTVRSASQRLISQKTEQFLPKKYQQFQKLHFLSIFRAAGIYS